MSHPLSRKDYLKISGSVAAGAGATVAGVTNAEATPNDAGRAALPFKPKVLSQGKNIGVNTALAFNFPDASSPCALIKIGAAVPGGVGPEHGLVYGRACNPS